MVAIDVVQFLAQDLFHRFATLRRCEDLEKPFQTRFSFVESGVCHIRTGVFDATRCQRCPWNILLTPLLRTMLRHRLFPRLLRATKSISLQPLQSLFRPFNNESRLAPIAMALTSALALFVLYRVGLEFFQRLAEIVPDVLYLDPKVLTLVRLRTRSGLRSLTMLWWAVSGCSVRTRSLTWLRWALSRNSLRSSKRRLLYLL